MLLNKQAFLLVYMIEDVHEVLLYLNPINILEFYWCQMAKWVYDFVIRGNLLAWTHSYLRRF